MELEHSWTSKVELLEDIIDNWLLEDFTKRSILAKNIFVVLFPPLLPNFLYLQGWESKISIFQEKSIGLFTSPKKRC